METQSSKKVARAQERNPERQGDRRPAEERLEEPFINIYPPLNEEAWVNEAIQLPVEQPPNNQEENKHQLESTMAALAKNFPVFTGKKSEDANIHVSRFEHYWKVARPRDPNLAVLALE